APGRRTDDVVYVLRAAAPGAHAGTGRRKPAHRDGNSLLRNRAGGLLVVDDPHPPTALRSLPGDGDVPAEIDQHAAADCVVDARGGAVGCQRLGRGAEVQDQPGRHARQIPRPVELDFPPTGDRAGGDGGTCTRAGAVTCQLGEIAVVAELDQGRATGRVDIAVGVAGRLQRHVQGLGEQCAYSHGTALRAVEPGQFRVGAEPGARQVDRGELVLKQRPAVFQRLRSGNQQARAGAQSRERDPDRFADGRREREGHFTVLADVVVCTGAAVVAGGLGGGATVEVFGAGAGAVERTGAGLWPPALAVVVAEPEAAADCAVPEPAGWPVLAVSAVFAGADRAKRVMKATIASVLSCVVRQVSLPRRRRPSSRPVSTDSSWRICLNPFPRCVSRIVTGHPPGLKTTASEPDQTLSRT